MAASPFLARRVGDGALPPAVREVTRHIDPVPWLVPGHVIANWPHRKPVPLPVARDPWRGLRHAPLPR